jgi:hypothetical protein
MVGGVQGSGPLSPVDFQPQQTNQDQTATTGTDQTARDVARTDAQNLVTSASDFEAYLNNATILTLETARTNDAFDTAQAIADASVYKDPGQSSPI